MSGYSILPVAFSLSAIRAFGVGEGGHEETEYGPLLLVQPLRGYAHATEVGVNPLFWEPEVAHRTMAQVVTVDDDEVPLGRAYPHVFFRGEGLSRIPHAQPFRPAAPLGVQPIPSVTVVVGTKGQNP